MLLESNCKSSQKMNELFSRFRVKAPTTPINSSRFKTE